MGKKMMMNGAARRYTLGILNGIFFFSFTTSARLELIFYQEMSLTQKQCMSCFQTWLGQIIIGRKR